MSLLDLSILQRNDRSPSTKRKVISYSTQHYFVCFVSFVEQNVIFITIVCPRTSIYSLFFFFLTNYRLFGTWRTNVLGIYQTYFSFYVNKLNMLIMNNFRRVRSTRVLLLRQTLLFLLIYNLWI